MHNVIVVQVKAFVFIFIILLSDDVPNQVTHPLQEF